MTDSPDSFILTHELIHMIQSGEYDHSLDRLKATLKRRQEIVDQNASVNLKPGDQFYIKDISPKYLNGVLVEFVQYIGGTYPVRVKFVYGARQYGPGRMTNLRACHIGALKIGGF